MAAVTVMEGWQIKSREPREGSDKKTEPAIPLPAARVQEGATVGAARWFTVRATLQGF